MVSRAVFIDRDGTIIEDRGYICNFNEVDIFPFAIDAIQIINKYNFKVIVITNQSSIARGICTEEQVQKIHIEIKKFFFSKGAIIDEFYYCPFYEEGVVEKYKRKDICRKPSPGMILSAANDFNINLSESFFIGDKMVDILAGKSAGCKTILVQTGKGVQAEKDLQKNNINPDFIAPNILSAVKLIF